MKIKQAYTLAEILIALVIVAVIAAIMLPIANKFKPDQDKAMYLKTYDSLVYSVKSLQDNKIAYPNTMTTEDGTEYDISRCLFINTENNIQEGPFAGIHGVNKLGQILGKVFNSNEEPTINGNLVSFKVNDDDWRVEGYNEGNPLNTGDFYNKVRVNHNNHDYEFCITANGNVIPIDVQGQAFLRTRSFWKKGNVNIEGLQTIDTTRENIPDIEIIYVDKTHEGDGGGGDEEVPDDDDTRKLRPGVKGYPCTESYIALDPEYNVYDKNGNVRDAYVCKNSMAYMELEDHLGNAEEAYQKCEELGGRLPTTQELSAAIKYHEMLGIKDDNKGWGNYISLGTVNDLKYYLENGKLPKYISNCSASQYTGNCGTYVDNRVEKFRCVFDD